MQPLSRQMVNKIVTEEDAGTQIIEILKTLPSKVVIKNAEDYTGHMALLKENKARAKQVEDFWEELIAPVREQKRLLETKRNNMLKPYTDRVKLLSDTCVQFFVKQSAKTEEKQAKENEKFEQKIETLQAQGKDTSNLAGPKHVAGLAKTTAGVSIQMRTSWRLRFAPAITQQSQTEVLRLVIGADIIPNEYWTLDRGKVWKDIQNGKEIPGIEAYKVPVTAG